MVSETIGSFLLGSGCVVDLPVMASAHGWPRRGSVQEPIADTGIDICASNSQTCCGHTAVGLLEELW